MAEHTRKLEDSVANSESLGSAPAGGSIAPGERAARERERLAVLGEIAAEIAHELQNVLQVISASAYLARHAPASSAGGTGGPTSFAHLAKIERSAHVAQCIVQDLMGLARGDALHSEPIFVIDLVRAAQSDLEAKGVWDERGILADLRVLAHPVLSARILHVMYENSIFASAPRRPTISTRAWRATARVIVEVTDDGPGIAADVAAHVFEPLVSARSGGSGLGLALAKRIAEAHGGTIALAPPSEGGRGATFRLELPAAD